MRFLALVISFYVVSGRRKIAGELEITSTAYLGQQKTAKAKDFLKSVDWVFGRYISAKLVQIILIFTLCQIAFLIIGAPYSTFLALIVAFTNVVPFIGPIIGAAVAVLITLLESPILALWMLGVILVIQTLGRVCVPAVLHRRQDGAFAFLGNSFGVGRRRAFWC